MTASWRHADVFPIIAGIIDDVCAKQARFVTHDEVARALLTDTEAARIIQEAHEQQDEKQSLEWLAHNMVAWFS